MELTVKNGDLSMKNDDRLRDSAQLVAPFFCARPGRCPLCNLVCTHICHSFETLSQTGYYEVSVFADGTRTCWLSGPLMVRIVNPQLGIIRIIPQNGFISFISESNGYFYCILV